MHPRDYERWFARYPDLLRTPLFELHVWLGSERARITAYEGPEQPTGHTTIYAALKMPGARGALFPIGWSWVGVPRGTVIDGPKAKEAVLSLFAMKPGDTDPEFFENYTSDQLAFVNRWGEELSMLAAERYGAR